AESGVARSAIRAEQRAPTRSRCGEPGEHCEHGRPKAALHAAEHEPIDTKPGTAPKNPSCKAAPAT
ncbi:MAG: hypothetical protein ACK6DV_12330, partial [Deltaproteobacteria bacterium]